MKLFLGVTIALVLFSCQNTDTKSFPKFLQDTSSYIRIYVDKDENISLNGNYVSLKQADQRLRLLCEGKGLVMYASESSGSELPKHGIVIDLLKKYEIGIIHYQDKNFTKKME